MRKIGFNIYDKKEKSEKIVEMPKAEKSEMSFKEFLKSKEYKQVLNGTFEGLKVVSEIGNGVLLGSLWAICTCFPVVGIPLKICTAVSCFALHDRLTYQTDKACDNAKKAANELIDIL